MRTWIVSTLLIAALALTGCGKRQPNLSPDATKAYTRSQIVNAIDDVRDTATSFHDFEQRPFEDVALTRRVVQAHQSALVVIEQRGKDWQVQAKNIFVELLKNLTPAAADKLRPYLALSAVLIDTLSTREIDAEASALVIAAYEALLEESQAVDAAWLASH